MTHHRHRRARGTVPAGAVVAIAFTLALAAPVAASGAAPATPLRLTLPPATGPLVPVPRTANAATSAATPAATAPRTAGAPAGSTLVGTFGLAAGKCPSGPVTGGSWFRMVQPGGSAASGPYVGNGDSPCGDNTFTPLSPGRDGGLATTGYQPDPTPAFDGSGGGTADRITAPQTFFGVKFAASTNSTDPQTGTAVAKPSVTVDGSGNLGGDLRAFSAAWNGQHFNQGSPKPDGSRPGRTAPVTGTYDASSGRFTLEWTSEIVGGPFNGFAGRWHLEGTFAPAGTPAAASAASPAATATTSAGDAPPTSTGAATNPTVAPATLARTGPPDALRAGPLLFAAGLLGLGLARTARRRDRAHRAHRTAS